MRRKGDGLEQERIQRRTHLEERHAPVPVVLSDVQLHHDISVGNLNMSTHKDGLDLNLSAAHGDLNSAAGVKKAR